YGDAEDKYTPGPDIPYLPGTLLSDEEYEKLHHRELWEHRNSLPHANEEGYYYNEEADAWVSSLQGHLDFFSRLDFGQSTADESDSDSEDNENSSNEEEGEQPGDTPEYEVTQGQPPESPGNEEKPEDGQTQQGQKPNKPNKPGETTVTKPDPDKDFNEMLKKRQELLQKRDQLLALDKQLNKMLDGLRDQARAAADLAVAFSSKSYDDFKDFVKDYTSGKAADFLKEKMIDKLGKYGKLVEKGLELKEKVEGAIETGERVNDLATGDTEAKLNAAKDFLKDACPIGEEIDGILTGAFNVLHGYELTRHAEELGNMLNEEYKKKAWILEDAGKLHGELGRLDEAIKNDPRYGGLSDDTKKQMNAEIEDSKFFRHGETANEYLQRGQRPSDEKVGDRNPDAPAALKDLPAYIWTS
ncbi:MAG TPA: hypothetical protein PKO06_20060, partial [Candidatus Ozemobacteraceae bacterium]|nr:hypothetical protein [Candidatus Ozemobacteraceae bacterium]